MDSAQEWTRGEIRTDDNHAGWYELRCHQTRLRRIHQVSFENHKKSMVAPVWKAVGRGRFYFYRAEASGTRSSDSGPRTMTVTTLGAYGYAEEVNLQLRGVRDGTGDSTFRC